MDRLFKRGEITPCFVQIIPRFLDRHDRQMNSCFVNDLPVLNAGKFQMLDGFLAPITRAIDKILTEK